MFLRSFNNYFEAKVSQKAMKSSKVRYKKVKKNLNLKFFLSGLEAKGTIE